MTCYGEVMAYDSTPLFRVRGDADTLDLIQSRLKREALAALNAGIAQIAAEVAERTGIDLPTARVVVASVAADGARTLQTVAAADARSAGVPLLATAQAMGYSSATPLQRDGETMRQVQAARAEAAATGKPVTVAVHGGWRYDVNP